MGREIYCQIRESGQTWENPLWDSASDSELFVCGRDDATGFIASRAFDQAGDSDEICLSDLKELDLVRRELESYAEQDAEELRKAEEYLSDLKAARRNARNLEEFDSFSPAIKEAEDWIDSRSWSRARALLDMIAAALAEIGSDPSKYADAKLYLVVSE